MDTLDPGALEEWSNGEWRNGRPSEITGLGNDTRTLGRGSMFAALKTARRDGHDFLGAAKEAGAGSALVEQFRPEVELPQLVVANVGEALLRLAAAYRGTWNCPVVGITGSFGKTTCKELLTLLLGKEHCLSTLGNLNNLIGVPMSILRPSAANARFAVLEAGISEPGEMEQLATAINPDWAVITAIGPAHLQDLGSEANVAIEKGRLAQGERVQTVFAGESCEQYVGRLGGPKVKIVRPRADLDEPWSYRFSSSRGRTRFQQKVLGKIETIEYDGVGNAMASNVALAVATAVSLEISLDAVRNRLAQWKSKDLRGEWLERDGRIYFVDCYNANPVSMRDALETFVRNTPEDSPRLFVIGCMEELGPSSPAYHEKLGIDFPFREIDFLLVLGSEASSVLRGMNNVGHDMSRCEAVDSLEAVKPRLQAFDGSVFLKGSRRYRLEQALPDFGVAQSRTEGGSSC